MSAAFSVMPLTLRHAQTALRSGAPVQDTYFANFALRDMQRRAARSWVVIHNATGRVAGFYTLAASGVPLHAVPQGMVPQMTQRLPRTPSIPVARLDHLAVDVAYQGGKLGSALLWDAVLRAEKFEIGMFALVGRGSTPQAEGFLAHHGFVAFDSDSERFGPHYFLPLTHLPRGTVAGGDEAAAEMVEGGAFLMD